ncbi:MAG: tannase/feruloyl esterase family alpha/beta hydrolase [Ramlibacter sp.]|nr:tannase/feruloyl esterase family alpha/beta hydrolase [Ramlibacter sp.]
MRPGLFRCAGVSLSVAVLIAGCGGSDVVPPPTAQQACASLAGKTIAGATVLAAAEVAAAGVVPLYCKVSAKIEPALNFEMRIPNAWNGKLYYGGGAGLNGVIPGLEGPPGAFNLAALKKGYITVNSDSGHQGDPRSGSWAIGNPQAVALYGHLSVPTVMASAVPMITAAYGIQPGKSYFEGCSNGGREALMNAQRYPDLFDGIIARAPALDFVGSVGAWNRNQKAFFAPGGQLTHAKTALLSNAVLASCDAADGVMDGVVSNPSACTFNPSVLRCTGGGDTGDTCLSDAQLAVVTSSMTPAAFAGGAYSNAGWALSGNESAPGFWSTNWMNGKTSGQFLLQEAIIKGLIAGDLSIDSLAYDYDSNPAALHSVAAAIDATNTDLRPFNSSGGKLIMWHGGADAAISARNTARYYQGVTAAVGGQANVDRFARYYAAPGVNHCGGGPGADSTDLLEALDSWVLNDKAPDQLTALKLALDGSTSFARPLCRHPQYPRYTGPAGDANAAKLATNYTCTTP